MRESAVSTTVEEQRALEAFYYYEARLLDSRQFQQWLGLMSQEVKYVMPARVNVQVDNRQRGDESMIAIANEVEGVDSMGCPLREDSFIHLSLRVERAYKINSWAEHPPARTRRMVGNVERIAVENGQQSVLSNFLLYYARPGHAQVLYSGQRRDQLVNHGDSFQVRRREELLDYANIELPTLGLLF